MYVYKVSEQLFYGKCVLLIMNTAPQQLQLQQAAATVIATAALWLHDIQ